MNTPDAQHDPSFLSRARVLGRWFGVDRAVFYTVVGRGWTALAGPISLLFVAHFMSREEQGFYYTFASILALQVFFELGLAYVIMQSVSHEKAQLDWSADASALVGNAHAKGRLASFFRLALRWYAAIAIVAAVVLAFAGLWFFGRYQPANVTIEWRAPWLLLVAFTGINLLLTPCYGLLEGCGKVSEIAALRARQGIISSVVFWIALSSGLKLYAAPLLSLVLIVVALFSLLQRRVFFADLLRVEVSSHNVVKWREEVLPFQWRIAVSWISGYFIFQLANPILFRYHGAAEAGRMGMTMRIIDSITTLAFAWVSTKSAPFGTLIAQKNFTALDSGFRKAAIQAVAVATAGCLAFAVVYELLRSYRLPVIDRLVEPFALYFLLGNAIINCIIFSQAVYLRAHKEEPFLINSAIGAIIVPCIMYFLGRPYGAPGIAIGLFAGGVFVGLPLATWIFRRKKQQWRVSRNA